MFYAGPGLNFYLSGSSWCHFLEPLYQVIKYCLCMDVNV